MYNTTIRIIGTCSNVMIKEPCLRCYTVSDMPVNVLFLMMNVHANRTVFDSLWYAAMFLSFLYFGANPFIYAIKFDPVKKVLLRMIPCRKTPVQAIESIDMAVSRSASRTPQPRN